MHEQNNEIINIKKCNRCEQEKSLNKFEFRKDTQNYRSNCKDCRGIKLDTSEYDVKDGKKKCTRCKEIKETANFSLNRNTKKHRQQCKTCKNKWKATKTPEQTEIDIQNNWKICRMCNEKLELKKFTFKNRGKLYYLDCRICEEKKRKIRVEERLKTKTHSKCREYKETKIISNFYKGSFNLCKECCYIYSSQRKLLPEVRERNRVSMRKYKAKYKQNPKWKIDNNISTAIRTSLNGDKAGRNWELLVGYTLQLLLNHLESLFVDGMTLDNYGNKEGQWVIDHVNPLELFNYENTEDPQFIFCWELKNLQPLWCKDNARKSDYLLDGRRARDLTDDEKIDYLKSLGYEIRKSPTTEIASDLELNVDFI